MSCSRKGRINIKMPILPKATYRLSALPIKIPMTYFTEIELTVQKLIWNHKRPQIATAIQLSYKANKVETAWHWHKHRPV